MSRPTTVFPASEFVPHQAGLVALSGYTSLHMPSTKNPSRFTTWATQLFPLQEEFVYESGSKIAIGAIRGLRFTPVGLLQVPVAIHPPDTLLVAVFQTDPG